MYIKRTGISGARLNQKCELKPARAASRSLLSLPLFPSLFTTFKDSPSPLLYCGLRVEASRSIFAHQQATPCKQSENRAPVRRYSTRLLRSSPDPAYLFSWKVRTQHLGAFATQNVKTLQDDECPAQSKFANTPSPISHEVGTNLLFPPFWTSDTKTLTTQLKMLSVNMAAVALALLGFLSSATAAPASLLFPPLCNCDRNLANSPYRLSYSGQQIVGASTRFCFTTFLTACDKSKYCCNDQPMYKAEFDVGEWCTMDCCIHYN